jgi:hypothetical protein
MWRRGARSGVPRVRMRVCGSGRSSHAESAAPAGHSSGVARRPSSTGGQAAPAGKGPPWAPFLTSSAPIGPGKMPMRPLPASHVRPLRSALRPGGPCCG